MSQTVGRVSQWLKFASFESKYTGQLQCPIDTSCLFPNMALYRRWIRPSVSRPSCFVNSHFPHGQAQANLRSVD